MTAHCLLALALFAAGPTPPAIADNGVPTSTLPTISQSGAIAGVVVNGSQSEQPVAGAKVILQLKSDGDFALLDETETDSAGRFHFSRLLVSEHLQYKTGTNYGGIHYPGPRIELNSQQNRVAARIVVRDTIEHPNPLVARQHVVFVESETGLLRITESMIIENPTDRCYVGRSVTQDEEEPETLQLSIPRDFLKVTFHKEFFGRAFAVKGDRLVTSLPWEPGQRELSFTYVLSNDDAYQIWQRPLDLPTDHLSVRIATDAPEEVACTLNGESLARREVMSDLVFESQTATLPQGQLVRIELGQLPVPWMVYGRWGAALALVVIVVTGVLLRMRRWNQSRRVAQVESAAPRPSDSNKTHARQHKRRALRKRRRAA